MRSFSICMTTTASTSTKSPVTLVNTPFFKHFQASSIKKEYPKLAKNYMIWGALKLRHNPGMRTSYQLNFPNPTNKAPYQSKKFNSDFYT